MPPAILSVHSGADTGGLSIGMKRAFDRCSNWPFRSLVRSSNYIRYPADAAWAQLRPLTAQADVLHLHNNLRTLAHLPAGGRGKGLVLYHHGSQFRAEPKRLLAAARRADAVQLASTLDIWSLAPDELTWIPAAYDLGALQSLRRRHYRPHDGIIIAHAPTNRAAKGTDALIAAVERLRGSYPIRLLLIERRSWAHTLLAKATADIFVDQLLLGYGCNGIEAMGMGIPLISGVDVAAGAKMARTNPELVVPPLTLDAISEHWSALPYLHATQTTITEALEAMIANPALRAEYAARGMAHAQRFHADDVVVPQLQDAYRRALQIAVAA